MGTDLTIFIEYDTCEDCDISFSESAYIECTSCDQGLYIEKDYEFIGAVHGFRNYTGIPSLYKQRPLPDNLSPFAEMYFKDFGESPGWLYYDEVIEALEHQNIKVSQLSFLTQIHLATMNYIANELGNKRRVRMLFDLS